MTISYTFLISSISNLSVFNILVFDHLTSSWILEFFNYFCRLLTILINFCFFCNCFLSSIFDYGLLTYGFSHSTAHASKATGLEWLEGTTSSHTLWHHLHATTTESSISKEIIVIIETWISESSSETHSHASKICKWIPSLFSRRLLHLLTMHSSVHSTMHSSETASHHWWETATKKVIIIVEKTRKWIFSSKELSKYIFCTLHVEVSLMEATKVMVSSAATIASASSTYSSLF